MITLIDFDLLPNFDYRSCHDYGGFPSGLNYHKGSRAPNTLPAGCIRDGNHWDCCDHDFDLASAVPWRHVCVGQPKILTLTSLSALLIAVRMLRFKKCGPAAATMCQFRKG